MKRKAKDHFVSLRSWLYPGRVMSIRTTAVYMVEAGPFLGCSRIWAGGVGHLVRGSRESIVKLINLKENGG